MTDKTELIPAFKPLITMQDEDGFAWVSGGDWIVISRKLESLEFKLEAAEARFSDLTYRHECLKSMYADEMNFMDDHQPTEDAINDFISEQESHS